MAISYDKKIMECVLRSVMSEGNVAQGKAIKSIDMIVNKVKSLPDSFKKYVNDYYDITETNMIKFCSYLCMKDANDNIVNGWLASQSDMLADDWMVVG